MDFRTELESCFEFINLTLDDNVLQKCEELCKSYQVDAEDFVNIWCAFAASTMCTDAPTLEQLEIVERKELQKYSKEKPTITSPVTTSKQNLNQHNKPGIQRELQEQIKSSGTGDNSVQSENFIEGSIPEQEILDESITNHLSSTLESSKYAERSNALSVRVSIGKELSSKHSNENQNVYVRLWNEKNALNADAKYMYEVLGRKISCLNNLTNWIGSSVMKKHNLVISQEISTKHHIGPITTFGKIMVDGEGHLNLQSIMLEGTAQMNSGHCVRLNVDRLPKIAIFPGQVVVVKGKMLSGDKLIADQIYTDASSELPVEVPVTEDPLRIIVAAGPFTLNDNINYDPMRDFMKYVSDNEPHVLILMGPFLDESHPVFSTGDLLETFDVFFESLIESISVALRDTKVQIAIVSSMRDLHHHNVYPTPPYKTRQNHPNVKFFPDPCVLNIEGLAIGMTTVDTMYHIAKEELVTAKDSDTMSRLASHIIQQNNFYPLYPPNTEVNVSHQFLESYGVLECLPHLMILPSTFRGFIRKINDCVVLNPERLTRGNAGGAFADIMVSDGGTRSIINRISCKILNI